jgi:hypothetical protein
VTKILAPPRRLERAALAAEAGVQRVAARAAEPRPAGVLRAAGLAGAAAILALFAFGTAMLATLVPGGYVALVVVALAALPLLLDSKLPNARIVHVPLVALIAVVVPAVTLLGADVVWATAGLPRPPAAAGLLIAAALVAGTAYAYLRWIREAPPSHPELWAGYAAAAGLGLTAVTHGLGVGLGLAALGAGVATLIYLARRAEPHIGRPLWGGLLIADVMLVVLPLWVEAARAGRVSLILLLGGAAIAVVAGVNGLWIPGDASRQQTRWAVALALGAAVVLPAFVALAVHAAASAPPPAGPVPAAVPTALPAAALAHRPVLLFDGGEALHTPLNVDRVLRSGDVSQCPRGHLLGGCTALHGAGDLSVGRGNLSFDTRQVAAVTQDPTIYVHVVPDKPNPGWTDLDYWWYLPDNPADTARGAMCGAGLVIPEITCFDHQSDWEGVTVVVDGAGAIREVHYAAHADVVSYTWAQLRAKWPGRAVAGHPLVYIARGTHAAYPVRCRTDPCEGNAVLEDNRHDGRLPWRCAGDGCVTAFPETAERAPAGWNAFDGLWGSADCLAGAYCSRSDPPASPARQPRFGAPWCSDFHQVGRRLRSWRPQYCSPAGLGR